MSFKHKVAIINGSRTPFVKSMQNYQGASNQDIFSTAFNDLVEKCHLEGKLLGDFIAGTVMNHPFAATGGRIIATAAKILKEKGKGRILISICTAGGMGVVAIIER